MKQLLLAAAMLAAAMAKGTVCPNGWEYNSGSCYLMVNDVKTYTDAVSNCASLGAHLPIVHSAAENDYLLSLNSALPLFPTGYPYNDSIWLGIHRPATGAAFTTWTDGSNIDYTDWSPYDPNNLNNVEDCVFLGHKNITSYLNSKWADVQCGFQMRSVCVKSACPAGWTFFETSCFLMVNTLQTYDQANANCASLGATLPTVHSQEKNDYLVALNSAPLTAGATGYVDSIWIGMHRTASGAPFTNWTDGSTLDYLHWSPYDPNNYNGIEDCVFLGNGKYTNYLSSKWADVTCGTKMRSVCEKQLAYCPTGWSLYGTNCYMVVLVESTQAQANASCIASGAQLAVITDYAQNQFVLGLLNAAYPVIQFLWLGATRTVAGGPFTWADGSTLGSYVNWIPGEPSNGSSDLCVEMASNATASVFAIAAPGQWNDTPCRNNAQDYGGHIGAICEKPAIFG